MELKLQTQRNDPVVRVTCEGHISVSGAGPEGPNPLDDVLGPSGFARKVLVDLTKATFLDSSGVSWLIRCQNEFARHGGMLVLHSMPPVVKQVFDLLRLSSLFNLAADQPAAEALASKEAS